MSHAELGQYVTQKCGAFELGASATYSFAFVAVDQLAIARLLDGRKDNPNPLEIILKQDVLEGNWSVDMLVDYSDYNAYDPSVEVRRVTMRADSYSGDVQNRELVFHSFEEFVVCPLNDAATSCLKMRQKTRNTALVVAHRIWHRSEWMAHHKHR